MDEIFPSQEDENAYRAYLELLHGNYIGALIARGDAAARHARDLDGPVSALEDTIARAGAARSRSSTENASTLDAAIIDAFRNARDRMEEQARKMTRDLSAVSRGDTDASTISNVMSTAARTNGSLRLSDDESNSAIADDLGTSIVAEERVPSAHSRAAASDTPQSRTGRGGVARIGVVSSSDSSHDVDDFADLAGDDFTRHDDARDDAHDDAHDDDFAPHDDAHDDDFAPRTITRSRDRSAEHTDAADFGDVGDGDFAPREGGARWDSAESALDGEPNDLGPLNSGSDHNLDMVDGYDWGPTEAQLDKAAAPHQDDDDPLDRDLDEAGKDTGIDDEFAQFNEDADVRASDTYGLAGNH